MLQLSQSALWSVVLYMGKTKRQINVDWTFQTCLLLLVHGDLQSLLSWCVHLWFILERLRLGTKNQLHVLIVSAGVPCPHVHDKSLVGVGGKTKFLCLPGQAASSLLILMAIHFHNGCKSR